MEELFLEWLREVVKEDNRLQFILIDCEERKEWRDWYSQGLPPFEAVKKNIELYG